jgi:RNA polymerase sigma factor (sigma-70 family)
MSQTEIDPAAVMRRCHEAVDRIIALRDWRLLDRDEFAQRVFEVMNGEADPTRLAMHVYSQALHAACSGAEGKQRQELGYTELFRMLYDSARRRYPDIYDEVAQQALNHVYTSFERCRQAGAFIAFALQYLRDSARAIRRQERSSARLPRRAGAPREDLPATLPDPAASDPAAQAIADELRAQFERLTAEFLRKHPRAARQIAALRLKYIDGLDEVAISRSLNTPTRVVYVLRARAIEKLRAEPAWRALAAEFGIALEGREASGGYPAKKRGSKSDPGEV